jgi:hypothetical protein
MRFGIIVLVQRAIGFLRSWFASMLQRPSIVLRKEYTMKTMTTYMLPTTDWALLLRPILMGVTTSFRENCTLSAPMALESHKRHVESAVSVLETLHFNATGHDRTRAGHSHEPHLDPVWVLSNLMGIVRPAVP